MRCTLKGCPGSYENKAITHTVKIKGQVVVIDNVPARVCDTCGDVLLELKTVRHVEEIIAKQSKPRRTAALYEYA